MFDVYPELYPQLLEKKVDRLKQLFDSWDIPTIEIYQSPPSHFRMRAEFRIWHSDNKINYAMFSKDDKRQPVILTHFPRASEAISNLMMPLLEAIEIEESLKQRLFQMDFLSSLSGEMLVTLIYHKKLDDEWTQAAINLQSQFGIKIIGRARKQKIVLSEDFIQEQFKVNNNTFFYQQIENSFTQPNAVICQKMLSWAVNNSQHFQGDLLELYCGNGNFTLPLAQNFNRVLATEVSKTSVRSAKYNINLNNVNNIEVIRMSSEEISQALQKKRDFRRLANLDLDNYQFSTLFLDPPRSGLDEQTIKLASQFDNIIYISCNPDTLVENLKHLSAYSIASLALFDQFPYTEHIECGVILRKT